MNAPKQVSLSLDAELLARAQAAGLDARSLATRAIRRAVDERDREAVREEIRREIAWYNEFVAEHGSFADAIREEFGEGGDAAEAV